MRCILITSFITILFVSCKSKAENAISDSEKFLDSLDRAQKVDSMVKQSMANIYWDTVGVADGPVQVISAKMVQREYSTYKDVRLAYKNVSGKKIEAVRFSWYGETAFGDPADMGGLTQEGFGGGFDDTGLNPGETSSGRWSVLSRNAKKVIKAWPREVKFEDGTKWESDYKKNY